MDQETHPILSKDFQQTLLASSSLPVPSAIDSERSNNLTNETNSILQENGVFELNPQNFDKWVPYLRDVVENDKLSAFVEELEYSIEDNFQGLELQLIQDSQINSKLQGSIGQISAVQEIIHDSLTPDVSKFQEQLTMACNELVKKKQLYVTNKKTSMKISETIILITKVIRILELSNKCQELITEKSFFTALQNLDSLEQLYLQEFKNYNFDFLQDIYNSIPFMKGVVKDECINLIRNSFNLNLGKNLSSIGGSFYDIYLHELLPQWLETRRKMKLGNFRFNSPVEISMRDQKSLVNLNLDRLFNLNEFHDAIMIFKCLNEQEYLLSEFSKEYEFRKTKIVYPLVWRRTSNNINAIKGDISGDGFTQLMSPDFWKDYLLKILGFLLYDINLNRSTEYNLVDNNYNATNEFWDELMERLAPYLRYYIKHNLKTEDQLVEFKDFLCLITAIIENLKLNINLLYSLLVQIFRKYCHVASQSFETEFQDLLNDDDFMPLKIEDRPLYEKILKICWIKEDDSLNQDKVAQLDNERFSVVLPFSPLYPMTCTLAKKIYAKLNTFVSLHYTHNLRKINDILINCMDSIFIDVVNVKIKSKLETTSREEIAQLLINLDYFVIAAREFSDILSKENIMQNPEVKIQLDAIKKFTESRKYAEAELIELIDSKITDILETVEIDWNTKELKKEPDISFVDAGQFLEMMFASTLVNLPYSVQTLLIFREFDSLTRQLLEMLLHGTPDHITTEGVLNFEADVKYIQNIIPRIFPHIGDQPSEYQSPTLPSSPTVGKSPLLENNMKSLDATFIELNQCIDLLKEGGAKDYLEPELRRRKYSRIKPEDANILLSKIEPIPEDTTQLDGIPDNDNSSMFTKETTESSGNRIAKFFNRR